VQTITIASYDERVNKNGKMYLVVKEENSETTYMCTDPRLFDIIKTSSMISAEVATETTPNAVFHKIVTAIQHAPGAPPMVQKAARGGYSGGSGGGGGGSFKADPYKQALIIRQSCLDRGVEISTALLKDGHLDVREGETVAQAIMRYAFGTAEKMETWVRDAVPVVDPTTPVTPPQPVQAAPTPQMAPQAPQAAPVPHAPVPEPTPMGSEENLPF